MLPARAEKHGRIVEEGEDFLESGEIDRARPGWIGFRPDGV